MSFGEVVATARKAKGLSQKELAALITKEDGEPISPQYLNDLERDVMIARDRVDWAAKKFLLNALQEEEKLSWNDPWLQSIDLEYHNVDLETGLYYEVVRQGAIRRVVSGRIYVSENVSVQMIRQHDERVEREGMVFARRGNRLPQGCDVIDEQGFTALQKVDREEPAPARNKRATIIRHGAQEST